jgi:hypothetical protein
MRSLKKYFCFPAISTAAAFGWTIPYRAVFARTILRRIATFRVVTCRIVTLIFAASWFFSAGISPAQTSANSAASGQAAPAVSAKVDRVTAISTAAGVDVEITTSRSIPLRSQVATGPDRLVLDFPNALPAAGLHNQAINQGEVKGIRVAVFSQNPPVTRVVIDLKSAQPYRIYPSGKTVIVKLLGGGTQTANGAQGGAHLNDVSFTPPVPAPPPPVLEVVYQNEKMSIRAHGVSLAQVLSEVQHKTGADIPIPSVASQEQVVADIGLSPVREALTALLNGSRFNFIIVGADNDPTRLKSVILSFRNASGISQPVAPVVQAQPEPEVSPQPEVQPQEGATQEGGTQAGPDVPPPQDGPPPQ